MLIYGISDAIIVFSEALMFWMLFEAFFLRKKSLSSKVYVISILLDASLIAMCEYFLSNTLIENIMVLLVSMVVFGSIYEGVWFRKILASIFCLFIAYVVDIVILFALTSIFEISIVMVLNSSSYRILGVILSKATELAICNVIRVKGIKQRFDVGRVYIGLFILLFSNIYIVTYLFFKLSLQVNNQQYEELMLVCSFGLFFSVFFALYLYEAQIIQERSRIQQQRKEEFLLMENRHLNELLNQQEFLSRFKHDFSNQLTALEYNLYNKNDDDVRSHIEKLRNIYKQIDTKINTGNNALDAVLNTKMILAMDKGIKFNTRLECDQLTNVEIMDVCVIFGNALDNAIEACERIKLGKKEISVIIAKRKQGVFCQIENTISQDVDSKVTVLENMSNHHGYGLRNIRDVLEKYHSELVVEETSTKFSVKFVIPNIYEEKNLQ